MNDKCKNFELNDEDIKTVSGGSGTNTPCPYGRSDFSYNTLCNNCEHRGNKDVFTFVCQLGVPGSYEI